LGWRSLEFKKETYNKNNYQEVSVVNYTDIDIPFTRIHEFRHLYPERKYRSRKTIIFKEYPIKNGNDTEPYYPVNTRKDRERAVKYFALTKKRDNFIFGRRFGGYEYLDMDETIKNALSCYKERIKFRKN
jgi:UDP-galactopyranose mutase